jgi:hypothetical protein
VLSYLDHIEIKAYAKVFLKGILAGRTDPQSILAVLVKEMQLFSRKLPQRNVARRSVPLT